MWVNQQEQTKKNQFQEMNRIIDELEIFLEEKNKFDSAERSVDDGNIQAIVQRDIMRKKGKLVPRRLEVRQKTKN